MGDMSDRVKLAREIAARTEPRFIDTTRDASTDHRAPAEANAHHFAARRAYAKATKEQRCRRSKHKRL
jgi:hypothetical protein